MSAQLLDGKKLSQDILQQLKAELNELKAHVQSTPRFMNIVVGQDPSAGSYGRSQIKAAEALGIEYLFTHLPAHITREELFDQVTLLNNDPAIHGIMIHKPLPEVIDFQEVANRILPHKDLEGINEANIGKLVLGTALIRPCTPAAVMEHLAASGVNLSGKDAVVVGRSEIVGKPVALMLLEKNATVTVCHSGTSRANRLEEHIRRADVLVVAVGKPGFVKGDWVKEGAIVVDVGINSVDGKLVGDVEFDSASKRASFITPVPGGVGPVTAVMLMKNGIATFKKQFGK